MKIVAIILNILLTGVIILFFVAVPIVYLIGFACRPGWNQMYFKRKAIFRGSRSPIEKQVS